MLPARFWNLEGGTFEASKHAGLSSATIQSIQKIHTSTTTPSSQYVPHSLLERLFPDSSRTGEVESETGDEPSRASLSGAEFTLPRKSAAEAWSVELEAKGFLRVGAESPFARLPLWGEVSLPASSIRM